MFNNFSILSVIIICFILSFVTTIYAYLNAHKIIKLQENKLEIFKKIQLYGIRIIHYSIAFFARLYPLLTELYLFTDLCFLVFCLFIVVHWFIFSECILSINEKQILDPTYVPGTNNTYQPFYNLINDSNIFLQVLRYASYISVCIVIIRVLFYKY
jgi:hypothetical protein